MKIYSTIALMIMSFVSEAYEVSGRSLLIMDAQTTVGLEALGVEAAKVDALERVEQTISKGDKYGLVYSYQPSIQKLIVLAQDKVECDVGICLETTIKLIVDKQIAKAISQSLHNSASGMSQLESKPKDVLSAQLNQFTLIESRHSRLPIEFRAEDGIYSQWLRLRAKEQKELVKRIKVSTIFKDTEFVPQKVKLNKVPVFDSIGEPSTSQYIAYSFALPGSEQMNDLVKAIPSLISDTRYVTMKMSAPELSIEQVEFRAKYHCMLFASADDYLSHQSLTTAQLFHREPEVAINVSGKIVHIGRGYYYEKGSESDSVFKRSGIPTYCELLNGELVFPKDTKQAAFLGSHVTVFSTVRIREVATDFHADETNIDDWLLVDSNFDKAWIESRYTDEINTIRQGCIDAVCSLQVITPKQFMLMLNGEPHVAFSKVAAGMRYPFRIERYQPTYPLVVPYVGLQTAGYGTALSSLTVEE